MINIIHKSSLKIFFILLLGVIGLFVNTLNAATYYSRANGNWNSNTTWSLTSGGAAVGTGVFPIAGDNVIIEGNRTVTITAAAACTNVTISSGSTLSHGGFALTVTGNTIISGTYSVTSNTGTKTLGNVTVSGGTWTVNANNMAFNLSSLTLSNSTFSGSRTLLNVSGTFNVTSGTNNNIGALTITVTGATTVNGTIIFTSTSGTKTFNGGVTINGGTWTNNAAETYTMASLSLTNSTINGTTNGAFTVSGNLTVGTGTNSNNLGNITINGTTTINGTFTIGSTAGTKTFVGNVNIAATGNWNNSVNEACTFRGGINNSGTFNAGTASHTFSTTNNQSLIGTLSIPAIIVTSPTVLTNYGDLTCGTSLTGTGGYTQAANSTLNLGGTSTVTTFNASANPNLVNYYGAAQTVRPVVYHNLTLAGSGAKTMTSVSTVNGNLATNGTITAATAIAMTVGGNLNINSGTFTVGGFNFTVNGATSVTGTLAHSSATGTKTYQGDVTINNGGSWTNAGNSAIILNGSLTNNGTLSAGTGLYTFGGSSETISGNNAVSIPSATISGSYTNTANYTSATVLTVNGTLTNNSSVTASTSLSGTGTFTQGANAILNIGGTSGISTLNASASGNTVNYTGAAQTVKATSTYHHLNLGGSGAKTLGVGTNAINGNFTLSGSASTTGVAGLTIGGDVILGSGTSFTSGTFTHNVSGNWTNNGGTFTPGSGTINFNNTSTNQTINGTTATQTFNNLTVAKGSTNLLLGGSTTNLTVGSTLTMSSGNIDLGNNLLQLGTSTSAVGTLTYSSGTIIGSFKRWTSSTPGSLRFPVGTSSYMQNALVTFANVTGGSLTTRFVASNPGSTGLPKSENSYSVINQFTEGYWEMIAADGLSSTNYALALTGNGFTSYTQDANTRIIQRPNGGGSWALNGTHTPASPPTANRNALNSFGEFTHARAVIFPTVSFTSASQSSVAETGTMTITAQLSSASALDVTVLFTVNASSTATIADYTISTSPITINAGSTTGTITITITHDVIDEPNETVVVNMGAPTNATPGAITTHTATITDDDDPPTVSFTSASQSGAENGAAIIVTAQLSGISSFPVSVPFSVNGASTATGGGTDYTISASPISIPAGSSSGNITITLNNDLLIEGNETIIINMGTPVNATQGATTTHTVTITDDELPPTVNFTTASSASVAETGTITLTVNISAASTLTVTVPFTVNVSSTATGGGVDYSITASPLSFSPGVTSRSIIITIVQDDFAEGNETVIVNLGTPSNATLGATVNHTATITDDDIAGFIFSQTSGIVTTESGGQGTFTVRLSSKPTADVVISFVSSDITEGTVSPATLTFTTLNWNSTQTITVTGVDDLNDDGDVAYTIVSTVQSSADPVYAALNPPDVSCTNTDNDSKGITVSPTSLTVTEASGAGNTATFTIKLNTEPTADVTIGLSSTNILKGTIDKSSVTFTSTDWNTAQIVTVTGINNDIDDGDVVFTITTAPATGGDYAGINASDVTVTNINDDIKGVTVTPTTLTTTEAAGPAHTATFTVVLNSQPTADVTITLSSSDTGQGTVSPTTLLFTTSDWATPKTVTVTGFDDSIDEGDVDFTIILNPASGGDYAGIDPQDVTVTSIDDDVRGVIVSLISGNTTEAGGTATFTVKLNSQPTATITIAISSNNTDEGTVSTNLLTFDAGNWNTLQTITVTGVDDDFDDGDVAYKILTAPAQGGFYNGLEVDDVDVINTDNDTSGFLITPITGLITTEAGGTASFTVKLTSKPYDNVRLDMSSSNTNEGTISDDFLVFTPLNWNAEQTVTITGVDDDVDDGDIEYSIITNLAISTDNKYNIINPSDVSVTNTDNDTAGILINPTSGLFTNEGGGTAQFTIVLQSKPTANVTIALSSSDTTEGTIAVSSVTFIPDEWNIPKVIVITGVNDFIIDGNINYSIITGASVSSDPKYNNLSLPDVAVTNNDDETAGITVTPTTGLITGEDGTSDDFTIALNSEPSANVTIAISSSNTSEGTVLPTSVTFTSSDWNTPKTITITGVNDFVADGDISYTIILANAVSTDLDYNGINPADVSVTNIDDDEKGFIIGDISGNTTEAGGTATFTIRLKSQPTASVTIPISSNNTAEGTVSPSSITFTTGNWNVNQLITVTGVNDDYADGDTDFLIVLGVASGGDYAGLNPDDVTVTNDDNDTAGINFSPTSGTTSESGTSVTITVSLKSKPYSNVTLNFASDDTDEGTVSPASRTFTTANWNTPQTFLITGVDDTEIDGDQPYTVTITSSSSDVDYDGIIENISMVNIDNDVAGFTITPLSGLVTTEAGGTATFTVKLNTKPTANVTLPLSSSNTAEGTVSPASLTFTTGNWNSPQTVTITGVNDALPDGNIAYSIITGAATSTDLNYSGHNPPDVSVTNTDLTPTINLGTNPTVCGSSTTTNLTYSATTKTPNQYSIVYSAAAITAGFVNVSDASLPASPIVLTVPAAAAAGTYTATLTVRNSAFGICVSPSYSISVTVNRVTSGSVGSDQTICSGGDPAIFTQLTASTGSGTLSYRWESSITNCSTGFTPISGATATTYDVPAGLTQTTFYRRVTISTQNSVACEANSNCITVTVTPLPAAPSGTAVQVFCASSSPTVANLVATGTAIQWYAASTGGSPLATSTPLLDGTHYYASQTVSGCESSSRFDVTATVHIAGTWLGTTSTDWHTASNWCGGVVPTAATSVIIPSGGNQPTISATAVCNNLTINTGATLTVAASNTLTISGNFSNSGTFVPNSSTVIFNNTGAQTIGAGPFNNLTLSSSGIKNTTGTSVNGILKLEGTATASASPTYGANTTLNYNGSSAQTTGPEFPATFSGTGGVIINNPNGVTLNAAKTISTTLTLTSGILTSSAANLLSVTNTSTSAISGGSATSFISGPVRWSLPSSLGTGSTYVFPVGKGSEYLPFELVNPTTGSGAVTAQVEAFDSDSGGTHDGTTLDYISPYAYWALATTGNFTNSSITLTRQTALDIDGFEVIGGSTTASGTYSSLGGTLGTYSISNSALIGSNRFFSFAIEHTNRKCPVNTEIAPMADQVVCVGSSANTLTATIIFGTGSGNPNSRYQWYYNTTDSKIIAGATKIAGATSATYTPPSGVPEEGSVRWYFCVGYSTNNRCGQSDEDQPNASEPVKVSVVSYQAVSLSINASPSGSVCEGTSVTYTAVPTNGGSTPVYQWRVNGINSGTNSSTFVYTPANGDEISCLMTSSADCVNGNSTVEISSFSWNDDQKALTDSDYGIDASSVYEAQYVNGGVSGTCIAPMSKIPNPYPNINLTFASSSQLDSDGIDYSVYYRRDENQGEVFVRGSSLIVNLDTDISVSYRVSDGAGSFTTQTSGTYAFPRDVNFYFFRFKYDPADGIGRLTIGGTEVWQSSATPGMPMYWTGAGNLIVGSNLDASGNQTPTFDNLSLKAIYLKTATSAVTASITPNNTIVLSSAVGTDAQTLCVNSAITPITYTTTGATGATFTGLPTGVSGNWNANTVTISGTPTLAGSYSYTVNLTGGCGTISTNGTIEVTTGNTIILSSAAGTDAQTKCINTAITNITYTTTGATDATVTGLPAGVTGAWNANTVTISGTPTASGTFNYTVKLIGGCGTVSTTGSIIVEPASVGGTASANQTVCSGNSPADITLAGNTGSIQWQWSTDNFSSSINDISGATAATLTSAQMGSLTATTYYRAKVTSGTCAVAYSNTVIATVPVISITDDVPTNICQWDLKLVTASASGGTAPYTYFWEDSAGGPFFPGNAPNHTGEAVNITTYGITTGTYTDNIKLTVTDANGCTKVKLYTIIVDPSVGNWIAHPVSVCTGQTGVVYSVDNIANTDYAWTVTGGTIAGGQGTSSITVNWGASGTGSVSVTATTNLTCVKTLTESSINIREELGITLGTNPVVCPGSTEAVLSYSATSGSPNQYSIDFNAAANTAGLIDITDAALAVAPGTITITLPINIPQGTYNGTLSLKNFMISPVCTTTYPITITVGDIIAPVLVNCPTGTLTFPPDAGLCSAAINTTTWGQVTAVSATDNCDPAPVISFTRSDLQTNNTFPIGSTTVTLVATDANTNVSTSCVFTILVKEDIPPTITCPPGQTIFCATNIPAAYPDLASFVTAGGIATDNAETDCGIEASTFTLLTEITAGSTITRTYEIADFSGNKATCEQVFTIEQPSAVTITSFGLDNTCPTEELTITSEITGYTGTTHYQWQLSTDGGTVWTNIGTDASSFTGDLGALGHKYRLLVSQTTDFSNVACYKISNTLTFNDITKPVFQSGVAPGNQTVCTVNGATTAAVYGIRLDNNEITDNCTDFADFTFAYSITGTTTASGNTNMTEGTVFNLGVSTVQYTVTDEAGNSETHSFTVTVNQSPAAITITPSVVSGGGTGIAPNQCGVYNYSAEVSPEAGFNYIWKVYTGSGTAGAEVTTGFTLTNLTLPGQASAVQIAWSGDMTPGIYTIELNKVNTSNNCNTAATLEITIQNSFDLSVQAPGQDCKGEVAPETPFTISWTVNRICGSTSWGFDYYIFNQDINVLPVDYLTVNNGNGSFSGITDASKGFNTIVINGHPYTQTVYTLFIVNASDSNGANNYNKFYLKAIPETSDITFD